MIFSVLRIIRLNLPIIKRFTSPQCHEHGVATKKKEDIICPDISECIEWTSYSALIPTGTQFTASALSSLTFVAT